MKSYKDFLPFALPNIGQEEIDEVVETLRSGWLTSGPKTKQFEIDFCKLFGNNTHCVAVNSATAGLHLALEAIGIKPGAEVITTPYTFTASVEAIRYFGAHPIFVDIDTNTYNLDPARIEASITPLTKAILPVHFAGLACDMNPILRIARKYNLKVIEDAAHALPTTYQSKIIGTLKSDVVVYSFYATKTITTGEGGMIVTSNSSIADRCRVMRLHGINKDVFHRSTSKEPDWYYDVIAPGFKYNMTDIVAAIGIHQVKKVWSFQKKRELIAKNYDKAFSELPLILPPKPCLGDTHSWHLYVIRLTPIVKIDRDLFIKEMFTKGIGCGVHFIPLHILSYWSDTYGYKPSDYPNALAIYQRVISLPIYPRMTENDQKRVIQAVKEILRDSI